MSNEQNSQERETHLPLICLYTNQSNYMYDNSIENLEFLLFFQEYALVYRFLQILNSTYSDEKIHI